MAKIDAFEQISRSQPGYYTGVNSGIAQGYSKAETNFFGSPSFEFDPATYEVDPNRARGDPAGGQGALTRAQWKLFEDKFLPLEDEALGIIRDGSLPDTLADRAGAHVSDAFAGTQGMTERRLSRYGQAPSAGEATVINRNRGLDQAVAHAGAENRARTATRDLQLGLAGDAMQIGQGISGQASEGLSSAGSMASARAQQGKAARAAQKQSRISTVGSLASAAIMAWALS